MARPRGQADSGDRIGAQSRHESDVDNLTRLMNHKEKEVALSKRESDGLKEDNERIHRMYMLM